MSRQRKGTRGMNGAGFGMLLDDKCFWKAKNLPLLYFDLCEKGEMGINMILFIWVILLGR